LTKARVIEVVLVSGNLESVKAAVDTVPTFGSVESIKFFARAGRNKIGDTINVEVTYPDNS